MAILNTYTQQPADRLDYDFEYTDFLKGVDAVESAVFAVEPAGMTLSGEVTEPTFTKVWASGGELGKSYKISCTITTAHGRVKQDEIKVRIKEY